MPEYKVLWLTWAKHRRGAKKPVTTDEILTVLRNTGSDGVDCHYDPKVVSADFIKAIRSAGFEFHVWTVDDLPNAREAFKRGVQTVTTNCANKLLDEYRKRRIAARQIIDLRRPPAYLAWYFRQTDYHGFQGMKGYSRT